MTFPGALRFGEGDSEKVSSAAHESKPQPKSRWKRFWKDSKAFTGRTLRATARTFYFMLAVLGGTQVYDAAIGDGPLPKFNPVSTHAPHLAGNMALNSTRAVYLAHPIERTIFPTQALPENYWQALQPTLEILDATCPEVAEWTRQHYQQKRALLGMPAIYPEHFAAAYNTISGSLLLGDLFWIMPDGDKASILVHEYRHARQSFPKGLGVRISQLLTGQILEYKCQLEDEAYEYQGQYYEALGR